MAYNSRRGLKIVMAALIVAVMGSSSVFIIFADEGTGEITGIDISESKYGFFSRDSNEDGYTVTFEQSDTDGYDVFILDWFIENGTEVSSNGSSLSYTRDGEVEPTIRVEYGVTVSTWGGFTAALANADFSEVVVDTRSGENYVLAYANESITINRNVVITGDNTSGYNGFIKGWMKGNDGVMDDEWDQPLITITSGKTVSINGITLDGGAVWSGETAPGFSRGTTNSGVRPVSGSDTGSTTIASLIKTSGNLTLGYGTVLCNNEGDRNIQYHGGGMGGGAVYCAAGTLILDGVLMKDCDAPRGGALYSSGGTVMIQGNTQVINNGGSCRHGGAMYLASYVEMSGGNFSNNYAISSGGAFIVNGNFKMSGGAITNNTVYAKISSDGNGNRGGGIFAGSNSESVIISGGLIAENKIIMEIESTKCGGGGISIKEAKTVVFSGGTIVDNTITPFSGNAFGSDMDIFTNPSNSTRTITGGSMEYYTYATSQPPSIVNGSDVDVKHVTVEVEAGKEYSKIATLNVQLCEPNHNTGTVYNYNVNDLYTDRSGKIHIFVPSGYASDDETESHFVVSGTFADAQSLGGIVSIIGTSAIGDTLQVDISKLTPDGVVVKYQWQTYAGRDSNGEDIWTDIGGAVGTSFKITADYEPGTAIRIRVYAGSYSLTGERCSESVTVYITYTIHYNTNGGQGMSDTKVSYQGAAEGIQVSRETPVKSGYHFIDWSDGKYNYLESDHIPIERFTDYSITLDAEWSEDPVAAYWLNGSIIGRSGESHTLYTIPEVGGNQVFLGWKDSGGNLLATGAPITIGESKVNLYAFVIDRTYHATITIGTAAEVNQSG